MHYTFVVDEKTAWYTDRDYYVTDKNGTVLDKDAVLTAGNTYVIYIKAVPEATATADTSKG